MDSPQSVVSPLKTSSVFSDSEKKNSVEGGSSKEDFIGALEVYIHQAHDIHNICIYQKQDVYAKLSLTTDPDKTVATKIINGGGRDPVFNENLSLNVRKVDSSLKCEVWMLSRVRNYLEDQLLGFALVPISDVLLQNGKLKREFSLSSTDIFHSPAGFIELSVSYIGAQPDVIPIPAPTQQESTECPPDDLDKIEFPDPKVANENHQMLEEYFGGSVTSDTETPATSEVEVYRRSEGFTCVDSPPSGASINGQKSPVEENSSASPKDEKTAESGGVSGDKPLVSVTIEPESKVVQQDIVDMYMKSMQQFTESLAKMKLPMDFENGPTSSENSTSSEQKTPASNNGRVFYGSRAFF